MSLKNTGLFDPNNREQLYPMKNKAYFHSIHSSQHNSCDWNLCIECYAFCCLVNGHLETGWPLCVQRDNNVSMDNNQVVLMFVWASCESGYSCVEGCNRLLNIVQFFVFICHCGRGGSATARIQHWRRLRPWQWRCRELITYQGTKYHNISLQNYCIECTGNFPVRM